MSRANDLEREARRISHRLAAGDSLRDVAGDVQDITTRLTKPGYTLHVAAYSAFVRSPTGRALTWLFNDRDIEARDRRAARVRRELIEDCYCAVIYPGWDSEHGSPLPSELAGAAATWPQTWRDVETYLAAIDLADNRIPDIERIETWWSRTFEDDFLIPGGRGVAGAVGEPVTLADYMRVRESIRGISPAQRAALTTARYLEESARREGLRWLIGR
ncbi:hypothetical protein [Gordonia otitidis]|nr:hypothetical protein [Gordonia otitidis]